MSLQACAELVRRGDPDRFLATMAASPMARAALFPIYAFNVEVARAPWVTQEPLIAEMRLQWWRDALAEIAGGGPVRAHQVTTPLAALLDARGADLLDGLIEARHWDIHRDPFQDADHFARYLDRTAGNLTLAAARSLGVAQDEAAIRDIAWAAGLANWFLAIPELEVRGRVPLVDGTPAAVRDLAGQGLARLSGAKTPRPAQTVLLAAWRAKPLLRQARAHPDRVARGDLRQSEFVRRWGLLRRSLSGL